MSDETTLLAPPKDFAWLAKRGLPDSSNTRGYRETDHGAWACDGYALWLEGDPGTVLDATMMAASFGNQPDEPEAEWRPGKELISFLKLVGKWRLTIVPSEADWSAEGYVDIEWTRACYEADVLPCYKMGSGYDPRLLHQALTFLFGSKPKELMVCSTREGKGPLLIHCGSRHVALMPVLLHNQY